MCCESLAWNFLRASEGPCTSSNLKMFMFSSVHCFPNDFQYLCFGKIIKQHYINLILFLNISRKPNVRKFFEIVKFAYLQVSILVNVTVLRVWLECFGNTIKNMCMWHWFRCVMKYNIKACGWSSNIQKICFVNFRCCCILQCVFN